MAECVEDTPQPTMSGSLLVDTEMYKKVGVL